VPSAPAPSRVQRLGVLTIAGSLAALSLVPTSPARALDLVRDGIVCDPRERACYDRGGAAFSETGRRYGSRAERDLRRRLRGRPPLREILFSSGELCDLQEERCWDDGWRRRNVANRLTNHLFDSRADEAPSWSRGERPCELRRSGQLMFRGTCRVVREGSGWDSDHRVVAENGSSFRFFNRGNGLWVSDASGRAPVTLSRRSQGVRFRWGRYDLDLDRHCELSRGSRTLYAGSCRLRSDRDDGRRSYRVDLERGGEYRFLDRGDRLVLSDAGRYWPVRTSRNPDELVFAWADRRLQVEHFGWTERPVGQETLRPEQELIRGLLNNVLDGLFR
jgi:hypothetical protein